MMLDFLLLFIFLRVDSAVFGSEGCGSAVIRERNIFRASAAYQHIPAIWKSVCLGGGGEVVV